jgi:hypothetical protein
VLVLVWLLVAAVLVTAAVIGLRSVIEPLLGVVNRAL